MKRFVYFLIVLLMLAGCDSINDALESSSGSSEEAVAANNPNTEPETTADAEPEPTTAISSNKFHHYNPDSYEMGADSSAFVLCNGQHLSNCQLNGKPLTLHGLQDDGRDVWMIYGTRYESGDVTCQSGDKIYAFQVYGHGGIQFGNCY